MYVINSNWFSVLIMFVKVKVCRTVTGYPPGRGYFEYFMYVINSNQFSVVLIML